MMLQLVHLLLQQQTKGFAATELPQEHQVHQDYYMDCGALPISLHQLELVQVRNYRLKDTTPTLTRGSWI